MKNLINNSKFTLMIIFNNYIYIADNIYIENENVEVEAYAPACDAHRSFTFDISFFSKIRTIPSKNIKDIIKLEDISFLSNCFIGSTRVFKIDNSPIEFIPQNFLKVLLKLKHFSDQNQIIYYALYMNALLYCQILKLEDTQYPRFVATKKDILNACLTSIVSSARSNTYKERFDEISTFFNKCFLSEQTSLDDYTKSIWQLEFYIENILLNNADNTLSGNEIRIFKSGADYISNNEDLGTFRAVTRYLAYAYYGGNSLYECDFAKSAKYLEKLLDTSDNQTSSDETALYLTSLGYIHYYGRISGKADLDLAKDYFTKGALLGNYEAKLKLYDIYYKYRNDPASTVIAEALFNEVFTDSKVRFRKGDMNSTLADSLIRYGSYYEDSCGNYDNDDYETIFIDSAFYYYLTSLMVLKKRMKSWPDKYGDSRIYSKLINSLNRIVDKTHFSKPVSEYIFSSDRLCMLLKLNLESAPLKLKINRDDGEVSSVTISAAEEETGLKLLITIPEGWYSNLVKTITLDITKINFINSAFAEDTVIFDNFDGQTFYLGDQEVGTMYAEFSYKIPRKINFLKKDKKAEQKSDNQADC